MRSLTLTKRELEVARLTVQCLSAKEIGHQLGLSWKTVAVHRVSLYRKLGIHSRSCVRNRHELIEWLVPCKWSYRFRQLFDRQQMELRMFAKDVSSQAILDRILSFMDSDESRALALALLRPHLNLETVP